MKNIKLLLLFCFFYNSSYLFSQEISFEIDGKTIGKELYKYVYTFDNEFKLISKEEIIDNTFIIKGNYNKKQRFGELAFIVLILSNEESVIDKSLLSKSNPLTCYIIAEPKLKIEFDNTKQQYTISGGLSNTIQSKFKKLEDVYNLKWDLFKSTLPNNSLEENWELAHNFKQELWKKKLEGYCEIIKAYPDSEVSLFNFGPILYSNLISSKQAREIFDNLSPRLRNSEYGHHSLKDLEAKID